MVLYTGSCVAYTDFNHVREIPKTLPVLGTAHQSALGLSLHDDAYAPLLSLSLITCSAWSRCLTHRLSPFFPASGPEFTEGLITSLSPAESAFTSCTKRVGFVVYYVYPRTDMDTELRNIIYFKRLSPPFPRLFDGFG